MEINPVLEEGEDEEVQMEEGLESAPGDKQVQEELKQIENNKPSEEYDRKEIEKAQEDTDIENLINDDQVYEIRIPKDKNQDDYEAPEVSIKTLPEHLLEQLHILPLTKKELEIGEYLIWNIRDDGYLDQNTNLTNVAATFDSTPQHVENVLKHIQHLDPTGVGSRDLRECLLIQLEDQEEKDDLAYRIIKEGFDDFKNKRYDKLISVFGTTQEELKMALDKIIRLNPKPGEGIFDTRSNYVVPDFIVEKVDDKFVVSLNDWNIPPLRISNTYKKMFMDRRNTDKETRQYIRKKVESARWFIASIYQRKFTMLKVMEAIIEKQYDFFNKGPEFIKPLIMREIAEMIEMDISTVSRVVNGKYVQMDYGVYELKYFFNERIETREGEEISTRKIKNKIKELLQSENPKKPLSDEFISELLEEKGFPIARRTVAKYREQLGIPVARLRRGI
jgi:RNA polymerase sigma-54 factor